jgi:hypothetical protein
VPAKSGRQAQHQTPTELKLNPSLQCTIAPGTFADDRLVRIELPDGGTISAIVDKSDVDVSKYHHGIGIGFLKVRVKSEAAGFVLVELPHPAFNGIQEFQIPRRLIHNRPVSDSNGRRTPSQVELTSRTTRRRSKSKRQSIISPFVRAR